MIFSCCIYCYLLQLVFLLLLLLLFLFSLRKTFISTLLGQLLSTRNTFSIQFNSFCRSSWVEQTTQALLVSVFNVPYFHLSGAKDSQFKQISSLVLFWYTVVFTLLFESRITKTSKSKIFGSVSTSYLNWIFLSKAFNIFKHNQLNLSLYNKEHHQHTSSSTSFCLLGLVLPIVPILP